MCVVCRQYFAKDKLLRVVVDKSGLSRLDVDCKADGRGAYVCMSTACLHDKSLKGRLEKSLGMRIKNEIVEDIINLGKDCESLDNL